MNVKRLLLAIVAVLVATQIMDFIVHSKILGTTYESLKPIWRPDMDAHMWKLSVIGIGFSSIFSYFYVAWRRVGGIGEGMKYGLIVGLIIGMGDLMQHVVYPVPLSLSVKWLVYHVVQCMVAGAIVSGIYRPAD